MTALINSYSKDIYERIGYIDNITTYEENSSFFQKSKWQLPHRRRV